MGVDWVRSHPGQAALVVAVEVPSLTFRPADTSADNLLSVLVFGDGAGAALLRGGAAPGRIGIGGPRRASSHRAPGRSDSSARMMASGWSSHASCLACWRRTSLRSSTPSWAARPISMPSRRIPAARRSSTRSCAVSISRKTSSPRRVGCSGDRQHLVCRDPLRARRARCEPSGSGRSRHGCGVRSRAHGRAPRVALGSMRSRARTVLALALGAQRLVELRISARNRTAAGLGRSGIAVDLSPHGRRQRRPVRGERVAAPRLAGFQRSSRLPHCSASARQRVSGFG